MGPNYEVDTFEINRIFRELDFIVGRAGNYERIVRGETEAVLKAAIKRTNPRTAAKAKAMRTRIAVQGRPLPREHWMTDGRHWKPKTYKKMPGRAFTKFRGKLYNLAYRYPNATWNEIDAYLKRRVVERSGAVGIAKKSFYLIGKQLGFAMAGVPKWVIKAQPQAKFAGAYMASITSIVEGGPHTSFSIRAMNGSTSAMSYRAGGHRAANAAVRGRERFFEKNLQLGVFADARKIAAKYPGMIVA